MARGPVITAMPGDHRRQMLKHRTLASLERSNRSNEQGPHALYLSWPLLEVIAGLAHSSQG